METPDVAPCEGCERQAGSQRDHRCSRMHLSQNPMHVAMVNYAYDEVRAAAYRACERLRRDAREGAAREHDDDDGAVRAAMPALVGDAEAEND